MYEILGIDLGLQLVGDVMRSWAVILIGMFLALGFAFLYMWVIEKCTKVFIWTGIIGTWLAIFIFACWCWGISKRYKSPDVNLILLRGIAIIGWVVCAIYFLILCCICKTLRMAIAIIEAAADFVTDTLRLVLVPVGSYISLGLWVTLWTGIALCIYSVGDIKSSAVKTKTVDWDSTTRYYWYYNFFALLWWIAMIVAVCQFIIIATCCTWYFSHNGDKEG